MTKEQIEARLQAMLFASGESVPVKRLAEVLELTEAKTFSYLEEMKESYLKSLENPDIDAETSYFVYWDTDKKEIVVLFGYDPGTYRDFEKSIDENEAPF